MPITIKFEQHFGIEDYLLLPMLTALFLMAGAVLAYIGISWREQQVAGADDYLYTPALENLRGTWMAEQLDLLLADPAGYVPGMTMQDTERRAAVIAYLESLVQR